MIVYLLRNTVTGKCYVGQTVLSLDARWARHVSNARHSNFAIHRAIAKHGIAAFARTVLAEVDTLTEANAVERLMVAAYQSFGESGYNQTIGGDGVMSSRRHSDETRRKISAVQKGRKQSSEAIAKRVAHQIGRPLSAEHRHKLSVVQKGRVISARCRELLAKAMKGTRHNVETRAKMAAAQARRRLTKEHYTRKSEHLDSIVRRLSEDGVSERNIAAQLGTSRGIVRGCLRGYRPPGLVEI